MNYKMYCNWHLKITYSTCCFCDKPILTDTAKLSTERIEFKRHVREFCSQHGLTEIMFGKYNTASVLLNHKCNHRDNQVLRLEVDYI